MDDRRFIHTKYANPIQYRTFFWSIKKHFGLKKGTVFSARNFQFFFHFEYFELKMLYSFKPKIVFSSILQK